MTTIYMKSWGMLKMNEMTLEIPCVIQDEARMRRLFRGN
jgi:hypothetical protein